MNFYREESGNAKWNAQRNLSGHTHYTDDDTLRYFKARILSSRVVDNGLLFALVESVALDPENRRRGYRYAIFDVFGTVLERPKMEDAYKSSKAATKAMWAALNEIDAKAHTLQAIERQKRQQAEELEHLAVKVRALGVKEAA